MVCQLLKKAGLTKQQLLDMLRHSGVFIPQIKHLCLNPAAPRAPGWQWGIHWSLALDVVSVQEEELLYLSTPQDVRPDPTLSSSACAAFSSMPCCRGRGHTFALPL